MSSEPSIYKSNFNIGEEYGNLVKCPICGCENAHIRDVRRDTYISTGNQGNAVIRISGECGHDWLIVFDGHKGELRVATILVKETAQLLPANLFPRMNR